MAFEDIIKQIEADAAAEVGTVRAEASTSAGRINTTARQQADKLHAQLREQAKHRATERAERIRTLAELEHRKAILAAKQDALADAFRQAEAQIGALPDDAARTFLRQVIVERAETGREEIVPGRAHAALFDAPFVAQINAQLGERGHLTVAASPGDFEHGVVLREGRKDINLRLSVLIQEARESLANTVARQLFPVADADNG